MIINTIFSVVRTVIEIDGNFQSESLLQGKVAHDSINSLTFADEVRQISSLLSAFVQKVCNVALPLLAKRHEVNSTYGVKINFGNDVEKQLNFYVDCRKSFGNLDGVKRTLVLGACNLAMKTNQIVHGKHTKKTASFIRVPFERHPFATCFPFLSFYYSYFCRCVALLIYCTEALVAYCFITIPSMEDVFSRLYLYVLSGQVAAVNQSIAQADSLFKAAITLIQEVPVVTGNFNGLVRLFDVVVEMDSQVKQTDVILSQFVNYLVSVLIAMPGHPQHGPFYLLKGLKKVVQDYSW